jgi:hypothetical protein
MFPILHQNYQDTIQAYTLLIDQAFKTEGNKEIDSIHLKRGCTMMGLEHDPDSQDWYSANHVSANQVKSSLSKLCFSKLKFQQKLNTWTAIMKQWLFNPEKFYFKEIGWHELYIVTHILSIFPGSCRCHLANNAESVMLECYSRGCFHKVGERTTRAISLLTKNTIARSLHTKHAKSTMPEGHLFVYENWNNTIVTVINKKYRKEDDKI